MDETRWIYVAMVVFLFLRWLINQFKVAAAKRAEVRVRRLKGFDEGALARAEGDAPSSQNRAAREQTIRNPQEGAQTLQELFQEIRQEIRRPEPVAPSGDRSPGRTRQTTVQQKKRGRIPSPPPLPEKPVPRPAMAEKLADSHYQRQAKRVSAISSILSDPEKTRHAVILREILGRPKGLE